MILRQGGAAAGTAPGVGFGYDPTKRPEAPKMKRLAPEFAQAFTFTYMWSPRLGKTIQYFGKHMFPESLKGPNKNAFLNDIEARAQNPDVFFRDNCIGRWMGEWKTHKLPNGKLKCVWEPDYKAIQQQYIRDCEWLLLMDDKPKIGSVALFNMQFGRHLHNQSFDPDALPWENKDSNSQIQQIENWFKMTDEYLKCFMSASMVWSDDPEVLRECGWCSGCHQGPYAFKAVRKITRKLEWQKKFFNKDDFAEGQCSMICRRCLFWARLWIDWPGDPRQRPAPRKFFLDQLKKNHPGWHPWYYHSFTGRMWHGDWDRTVLRYHEEHEQLRTDQHMTQALERIGEQFKQDMARARQQNPNPQTMVF